MKKLEPNASLSDQQERKDNEILILQQDIESLNKILISIVK